jgi:hypothetical protein
LTGITSTAAAAALSSYPMGIANTPHEAPMVA